MNKNLHKTIINRNTGLIVVVAENKMAVFSFSGSLKNNFDAAKVQGEIDLQREVTQEFSRNVQDLNRRKNIELDELKEELKAGKKTQEEYDQAVKKIETEKVIINMLAGGLMSPSDSVLGIATSTVSPAVSYAVGQHFKKEGKEGSFEHIATHAVIGALTSAANGGNALSGAVSAGGAEAIAPIVAKVLYGKDNSQNLTADEKETVVSVTTAISTLAGGAIGDSSANAYIGNTVAGNAVENNYLFPPENERYEKAKKRAAQLRYGHFEIIDGEMVEIPLTQEERKELAELDAKIAYYDDLSESRDKEFHRAYDDCRENANCNKFYHLHVTQRKEWTDKGVEQFKQDLKNGKLSENWILEKDEKNMFHNFSDDGIEVLRNPDGTFVNAKYTHKNGQYEVIVNKQTEEIVMHPNNAGTFNYYANSDKYPGGNQIDHMDLDVDPWMDFGNGLGDRTTWSSRKYTGQFSSFDGFMSSKIFGEFTTWQYKERGKATNAFKELDRKSSK